MQDSTTLLAAAVATHAAVQFARMLVSYKAHRERIHETQGVKEMALAIVASMGNTSPAAEPQRVETD